ncbi:MAG: 5-formyltetrahydrofolate cyclo-ligase [Gammaproteobacteria bacterium]|nr:MAG: 5-formyltetrahydrofolate cyclo-ligase [Gammaproteobacteria bacterium]
MVKEEKEKLRRELIEKRRKLPKEEIERLSLKVIEKLKTLKEFKRAKTVMLYYPARGEVDLRPLMEEVLQTKTLLLPKVTADNRLLALEVKDLNSLRKGAFGIYEPIGGKIFKPEKIDFIAVPGVAFDRKLNRLGMGKGFYDRFLPRVKGFKVGVAYDFQLVESLPTEEHDAKLNAVVTSTEILR